MVIPAQRTTEAAGVVAPPHKHQMSEAVDRPTAKMDAKVDVDAVGAT
jgi:hypothetical protein